MFPPCVGGGKTGVLKEWRRAVEPNAWKEARRMEQEGSGEEWGGKSTKQIPFENSI